MAQKRRREEKKKNQRTGQYNAKRNEHCVCTVQSNWWEIMNEINLHRIHRTIFCGLTAVKLWLHTTLFGSSTLFIWLFSLLIFFFLLAWCAFENTIFFLFSYQFFPLDSIFSFDYILIVVVVITIAVFCACCGRFLLRKNNSIFVWKSICTKYNITKQQDIHFECTHEQFATNQHFNRSFIIFLINTLSELCQYCLV